MHKASIELGKIFKHPESGILESHSLRGYRAIIKRIEAHLKRKYPNESNKNISYQTINYYILGKRKPVYKTVGLILEAFEDLYGEKIKYDNWFIDSEKYLNIADFSPDQRYIIRNLCHVTDKTILEIIKGAIRSELAKKGISIRGGQEDVGEDHVRISIGTKSQNISLIENIKEIINR